MANLATKITKKPVTVGKWIVDYIREVSLLLFEKTSDYICKLTVTFYLSYLQSAIKTTSDT